MGKRDQLIDAALRVFQQEGFRAAGIDRILAEAGVAKMTLYNHFRSKDDLILAVLHRRDEQFRHWLVRSVEARARAPRDRLLALFDVLAEWHTSDDFRGCLFLNVAAEFLDPECPARGAVIEHKRLVRGFLTKLAREAGAPDPVELAWQISILADGASAQAAICLSNEPARKARTIASAILSASIPDSRQGEGTLASVPMHE